MIRDSEQIFHTTYATEDSVFEINIFETHEKVITKVDDKIIRKDLKEGIDEDIYSLVALADIYIEEKILKI